MIPKDPWESYVHERNELDHNKNRKLFKEYKIRTEYEDDIDSPIQKPRHPNELNEKE